MELQNVISLVFGFIGCAYPVLRDVLEGRFGRIQGHPQPLTSPKPDLLDLSFILLFASVIAFVSIDSLLIAGRVVSLTPRLLAASTGVAAIVGVGHYYAYARGHAAMVVGTLACGAILVLCTTPGGPFQGPQAGASTPDLLLPTIALLTMASAAFFYRVGSPLSTTLRSPAGIATSLTLLVSTAVSATGLGIQLTRRVEQDPSVPKLSSAARLLLARVQANGPEDVKRIYQLTSEHHLVDQYQVWYSAARMNSAGLDTVVTALNQAKPADSASALSDFAARRRRQGLADDIYEEFARQDSHEQTSLLALRLTQVHALGVSGSSRAPVPMPGRTSLERFTETGYLRQIHAISKLPQPSLHLTLRGLDYDERVREYFLGGQAGAIGSTRRSSPLVYSDQLFVDIPETPVSRLIEEQLLLNSPDDGYLAYQQYRALASRRLRALLPAQDGTALVTLFDAVPLAARRALDYYNKLHIQTGGSGGEVVQMLSAASNARLEPLRGERAVVDAYSLLNGLDGMPPCDGTLRQDLRDSCLDLLTLRAPLLGVFKRLATQGRLDIQFASLLDPQLLRAAHSLVELPAETQRESLNYILNPAASGLIAVRDRLQLPQNSATLVEDVRQLDTAERESLLLALAMSLFQSGGSAGPGVVARTIVEAGYSSTILQLVLATLIYVPGLCLCLVAGELAARRLAARDTVRRMIVSEEADAATDSLTAAAGPTLVGRDPVIEQLVGLARRGWSTIAIAGRRGVGKSRLLHHLLQRQIVSHRVGVWIVSPTTFTEEEFIEEALERLASSTEAGIGGQVGAQPLSVRHLAQRSTRIGVMALAIGFSCAALVVQSTASRFGQSQLSMSLLPAAFLALASFGAAVVHLRRVQPTDLSRWIEREHGVGSEVVALYRDTVETLRFLAFRRASTSSSVVWRDTSNPWAVGILAFTLGFGLIVSLISYSDWDEDSLGAIVVFGSLGAISAVGLYFTSRGGFERFGATIATSRMVLVDRFRRYAATVVRRVRGGALGTDRGGSAIVICLDELDKVVDLEELRQFVRRIKSIFDIDGVSYYLSISEDALKSLVLGSSVGKNEVDSSFDHIVFVSPLELDDAERLAQNYATDLLHGTKPVRSVCRVIAAMSFGIPRDIGRRCDENADTLATMSAAEAVEKWLSIQLRIGQTSGLLSEADVLALQGAGADRLRVVCGMLDVSSDSESRVRHLCLIGSLVMLSLATRLPEAEWKARSNELAKFGYELPVRDLSRLRQHFKELAGEPGKAQEEGVSF